jgi:hypothetical protein
MTAGKLFASGLIRSGAFSKDGRIDQAKIKDYLGKLNDHRATTDFMNNDDFFMGIARQFLGK